MNPGDTLSSSIGSYQLLRELGRGAHGSTWVAEVTAVQAQPASALQVSQRVCIKLPMPPNEAQPEPDVKAEFARMKASFANEYNVGERTKTLRFTARFLDSGPTSLVFLGRRYPLTFLVYEFVDGPTLDKWLKANTRRLGRRATYASLATQLIDAVDELHSIARIVHGDLRLANIILRDADQHPVILDLGQADNIELTLRPGRVRERLYGRPPEGKRMPIGDVYMLGAVLLSLAVGGDQDNEWESTLPNIEAAFNANEQARELLSEFPELPVVLYQALNEDPAKRIDRLEEFRWLFAPDNKKTDGAAVIRAAKQQLDNLLETITEVQNDVILVPYVRSACEKLASMTNRIAHGWHDIAAPAREVDRIFAECLNCLDDGDAYLTPSELRFWATGNIPLEGLFLAKHLPAAMRKVTLRRVFLVPHRKRLTDYEKLILKSHGELMNRMDQHGVRTRNPMVAEGGAYTGVIRVHQGAEKEWLEKHDRKGVFILNKDVNCMIPVYAKSEAIDGVQYRKLPISRENFIAYFQEALLVNSIEVRDYLATLARRRGAS